MFLALKLMTVLKWKNLNIMEAIPLCDSIEVHTYLRLDTTNTE
jgi:hypothetical protein